MDQEFLDRLVSDALKSRGRGKGDAHWRKADLSFKLHAGQKIIKAALARSTGQLFVGNIARQFGKSYWAVTEAVSLALKKPRARIKYGTAFLTDLEEFILPTFEEVLLDCPDDLRPVYKVQGSKWVFHNGSEIKLVGLDKKPNGLRGNVIDLIILDECGFVANLDKLYRNVIIPATTHRPNCKIILISTPPETPAHPFVDFIVRADLEGSYVKLDIYQNPLITQADIDRLAKELGGVKSVAFRRECLCELIIDTSIAILPEWPEVEPKTVVQHRPDLPPFYHAVVAGDLGLNDDTGVVFGYWDFRRARLVVQAELLLNGVNSEELTKACLKIERGLWGDGITPMRWFDGQLYTLNDISSIHKYNVSPPRKDEVEAQVNSLRLMLQAGQIEIYDSCKQTIRQCATGIWDKSKTKFARSGSCHQDLLASLIYMVRHINKENPYPANYQFNRDTMHWRKPTLAPHHEQLKKAFGGKSRV